MRTSRPLLVLTMLAALLAGASLIALGCGGSGSSHAGSGDGGDSDGSLGDSASSGSSSGGGGDAGFQGDADLTPDVFGSGPGNGSCLQLGAACHTSGDCCSSDCVNGSCAYPACHSDNTACTSNGQCCSQTCSNGKCKALNTTARRSATRARPTRSAAPRCARRDLPAVVLLRAARRCVRREHRLLHGRLQRRDRPDAGHLRGVAAFGPSQLRPRRRRALGGGAADGGAVFIDSGLPKCGGPCCSRACAPWGPTGVLVCQPASGCHPVGDLCAADVDCCGAAASPAGPTSPSRAT